MIKKAIIVIAIVLFLAYIIPLSLVVFNKDQKIDEKVDYLIVLGAKVNGDKPSLSLAYRLDQAYEYYKQYPDTKIIVTGGQGMDEQYPEALVMKNYLIAKGIDEKDIIVEDQSTSTFENLKNAEKIIGAKEDYKIGVVTNDFHIYRSSMICQRVFNKKCMMQSARNYRGFDGVYSLLREPFALYKSFFYDR